MERDAGEARRSSIRSCRSASIEDLALRDPVPGDRSRLRGAQERRRACSRAELRQQRLLAGDRRTDDRRRLDAGRHRRRSGPPPVCRSPIARFGGCPASATVGVDFPRPPGSSPSSSAASCRSIPVLADGRRPGAGARSTSACGSSSASTSRSEQQFVIYVDEGRCSGDFGTSVLHHQSRSSSDLLRVFPATLELATLGTLIGVAGRRAAGRGRPPVQRGRLDRPGHPRAWACSAIRCRSSGSASMGLLVFYAKLGWVAGPGRVDIVYEDIVTPVDRPHAWSTRLLARRDGDASGTRSAT